MQRIRISLRGIVQGVGFRPFVYQLAQRLGLKGWVQNTSYGILVDVEGDSERLQHFVLNLQSSGPPHSSIQEMKIVHDEFCGFERFDIRKSDSEGDYSALILPDIATCRECLEDILDPANRRYNYPFTNCTQCGPRFSIIESLPYDRVRTSMKFFEMCHTCQEEYEDPEDRRFHAQPNACPDCGPHLEFWDVSGNCVSRMSNALMETVQALHEGAIVAVKGLGGFHLITDARNQEAVARLRKRKYREHKPFAVLFPSLQQVRSHCEISVEEEKLLLSSQAPIVLLQRRTELMKNDDICSGVAPGNPYLGVMLPSNPLHHLLMNRWGHPVVATSGNIAEEVICKQEDEALSRLAEVADHFLVHNRPIVQHADDSIARVVLGREQILRRARGYAPAPILLREPLPPSLAVGGHIKNSIAFAQGSNVIISQHLGDLDSPQTVSVFRKSIDSMTALQRLRPEFIACDMHPDYASTRLAEHHGFPCVPIQHHIAHVFSCMAENGLEPPILGVAWDGSGYGLDGTVWGGEFFRVTHERVSRIACFRPFPLPGSTQAVQEPRRSALGVLYELMGEACFRLPQIQNVFDDQELSILKTMLADNINSPMTSSCGRLFDAVSSLTGLRQRNSFEGQAAMDFEFAIPAGQSGLEYPVCLVPNKIPESIPSNGAKPSGMYDWGPGNFLDWAPLVDSLMEDLRGNVSPGIIALKFHNTLASAVCLVARQAGIKQIVLTGGCFQNKTLTEKAVWKLRQEDFQPYWQKKVPPNDGGLALGQLVAASWQKQREAL